MYTWLIKLIGSKNERELRRIKPLLNRVNELEPEFKAKDDGGLRAMTALFRQRLDSGASLDELLPEAFATVREASRRTLEMRPFDVQVLGGIILHEGKIAEMKTGEGKTLVATMPVYLNALLGKGVHVVTVNDYLARRDSEWMGTIYRFLGLDVGVIVHGLDDRQRKASYQEVVGFAGVVLTKVTQRKKSSNQHSPITIWPTCHGRRWCVNIARGRYRIANLETTQYWQPKRFYTIHPGR